MLLITTYYLTRNLKRIGFDDSLCHVEYVVSEYLKIRQELTQLPGEIRSRIGQFLELLQESPVKYIQW